MKKMADLWRAGLKQFEAGRSQKSQPRRPVRGRTLLCESLESRELLSAYYVSYSAGNDAYDGLAGSYDGVHGPWKTVAKVNGRSFSAGDSVNFKRGDTWREQLQLKSSGTSTAPITYGAYGTGADPILSGANVVSGWSLYSDGASVDIYRASVSGLTISRVFVDGALYDLAHSTGWNIIDSTSSSKLYLTDADYLNQTDNYWVSATAVVKTARWLIENRTVTASSQSAHTITWDTALDYYNPPAGYGYYLEAGTAQSLASKLTLLDTAGEYFVDATYVYVGLANGQTPTGKTIEASVRDFCITASDYGGSKNYWTLDHLQVTKAAHCGIDINIANHFTIQNLTNTYSKTIGIYLNQCTYGTIENTHVSQIDGVIKYDWEIPSGITAHYGDYIQVLNCELDHIGSDTDSPRMAVATSISSSHSTVSGNLVDWIGGSGLTFWCGGAHTITHNTLTNCSSVLDDEGAIYLNGSGGDNFTGTVIEHNSVSLMPGNLGGTPYNPATDTRATVGIYLDTYASNAIIRGNLVTGCSYGVELHWSHGVQLYNNTFYNNTICSIVFAEAYGGVDCMYGNVFKNNLCYAVGSSQRTLRVSRETGSTVSIGTFDYNLYYNASTTDVMSDRWYSYTLAEWRAQYGQEAHSLQASPALVDATNGNFHLVSSSLCINAGTSVGITSDYDGTPIPQNGAPDIGAYEYVNQISSFDVQKGLDERSFIRFLDLYFARSGASDLLGANRVTLTRYGLDGGGAGVNVSLSGKLSASGNTLALNFGAGGIGGNRNSTAGDGYYDLALDLDGDGDIDAHRYFYRLFGDVTGDRAVDSLDARLILLNYGSIGSSLEKDANGDGVVNAADRTLAIRSIGRLASSLTVDD